ncbi:hypothetical protein [Psychroserpens sp. SPM9]|uniref:hypothetical protein n=1 Tax=Psychroserpens sp. SPM9 TaxID=2975598 RepID=UPI0021A45E04|nr:hypothetical protein [Psychroserpens sp. SPM9]MDG5491523.1 hypothetical protein [Psychroserpens sp. SPM9]
MNKSMYLLIIFFLGLYTTEAQETLEINTDNLSKKWELVDIINPDRTEEELKEMLSFLEGTTMLLNKDFTSVFSFVQDLEGTWSLNSNVISIKNKRGETLWTIHDLQSKQITLSRNTSKQKLVFKSVKK